HLDRAERYLQRNGGRAVFLGRFTAALRVIVPGLAGMSGLPYRRFLAYNAAGGLLWSVAFVLAGYLAGDSWKKVEHVAGRAGVVLLLLALLVGGVVVAARWAARHQDRFRAGMAAQLDRPGILRLRARYGRQLGFLARRVSPSGALGLSLTASLAALVVAGWGLGAVVQDVLVGGGATRLDLPVLRWFARHREPWLTTGLRTVTVLGDAALLIPLVLVVGFGLTWRLRRPRPLTLLVAGYGGADLLSQAIRALTARTRPPPVYAVGHFAGHSFPSGHTTEATAAFGMLAAVLAAATPRWQRRVAAWAAAVVVAGLVGISRLYLGAHWLTDVLAGWALGSTWLLLVVAVDQAVAGLRPAPVADRLQMQPGRNKS
ncbi:MAG TPA: bifunctional DedA family/phosphatase PAP2 family protein, partial [Acidimicrobiia bacterium]|nr:bifunctional DedA family/phosphatase PAP2 family protein [Acidimicrobiia bacterium]